MIFQIGHSKKVGSDILEFSGKSYLVLIDYYSKWLEVIPLISKTAKTIIENLKIIFATHGIPNELVADNMPYNSFELRQFANELNLKIITSSPHYPKSNGLAEKAVGIAKMMLRKGNDLSLSLLNYRNTPVLELDLTPSQLLMHRGLRTKLPVLESKLLQMNYDYDCVKAKIECKRQKDKRYYDKNTKERADFVKGENIVMINKNNQWEPGNIVKKLNDIPRSYIAKNENNKEYRRNSVHLRKSVNTPNYDLPEIDKSDSDLPVCKSITNHSDSANKPSERPGQNKNLLLKLNDYVVYK